jgi:NAD(P)-dependent dehydrogenase (short-subunit alcohol dehydrogenase family)
VSDPPVALVTGSAGGLGRAIVESLSAAGFEVAAATHRGGQLAADLSHPAEARDLVRRVVTRHGRLDLLVANHAAMTMAPIDTCPVDEWWSVVDVNLSGCFYLAQAAVVYLRRSHGSIILVSSEWGLTGWPEATAYAASKAGIIGLMKSLALALAPDIRVNAVAPGVIDTPQLAVDATAAGVSLKEMKARYARDAPLKRIATPAEIASTVVFMASRVASFYTGQVFRPNGGISTPS